MSLSFVKNQSEAQGGSIKLVHSKKGVWYVCVLVSWEVPEPAETTRFIGVDRGQNHLAVAVTLEAVRCS